MKPAANLSLLWSDLPYLDRFEAAAAAGFTGVEVLFPYDVPAKETQRALIANGLELVLINAPPPNYTGGPRGFAADPQLRERFQHDMRRAFRYVDALGVSVLHVMAGPGEGNLARACMIDNLAWATEAAPEGLMLTIEPLCEAAQPGYFLNDYNLAAGILDAVAAANVGLQFDSFHAQMIHGDAVAVFEAHRGRVRHVQIGDAPERSAPGTGTVDFDALFAAMRGAGYEGWISGEYHAGRVVEKTLGWMRGA